jgi:choline monooxygenase
MEGTAFRHEERIELAATPPSYWYTDPEFLQREKRQIFSRSWQLVGREDQVGEPGSYFVASVADEQVVIVRGKDARLRALSNVCRHRAGPVARGAGKRMSLQCAYHGWTYGLDGTLLGTPEVEGMECFAKELNGLPEFSLDTWNGLIFVNLDSQSDTLAETLEDIPLRLAHRAFTGYQSAFRRDWTVECNWKVYVDNYLEGYHIPLVHPGLNKELDYARYRVETHRYYSIQHAPVRRVPGGRIGKGEDGAGEDASFFWIFPNLMLNVYPDNFSTNLIVPLGPERTLTVFEWFFREPNRPEVQEAVRRVVEFSDEVQVEDIGICEDVQRGLRSSTYSTGRYSVKRENGVHHFHGLVVEALAKP